MKFTPYSIKNQEFNRAVRGYDKEEVETFLEKLSDEFERLINENENYSDEIEELKEEITEFKRIEKNLRETMLKANESSAKALDSTRKQTALMIKEAELKAVQIVDKAKEEANFIKNAVMKLKEEKQLFYAKLRAMVDTQSELLAFNVEKVHNQPDSIKQIDIEETKEKEIIKPKESINVNDILEKLL
jgi:cell division initiation protein